MRKQPAALLAAVAFAALVLSGCASTSPSGQSPPGRSGASPTTIDVRTLPPLPKLTGSHAHPTFPPCVYPTAPSDLVDVTTESDLVVEATIEPTLVLVDDRGVTIWRQPLDDVTVVRTRAGTPADVDGLESIQQDGETQPGFWTPGRYLLFLLPVRNRMSEAANGMFGMFSIQDGKAIRYCPNVDDPEHPFIAPGPVPSLEQLIALIPDPLPARP